MSGAITSATFERDADGRPVIEWNMAGATGWVDIAWGVTPEAVDHRHARTVNAGLGRVVLDEVPPGRHFVSVSPAGGGGAVIAGERNLGLAGARNFRDLGGYRGAGGARTRWGKVFRSDALVLKDQDLEGFGELGIRTVYDLRSDLERETTPNRLPGGSHVVELVPLLSEDASPPSLDAVVADGETFLASIYLHMMERSAHKFGRILSGLADGDRLPAVFHCAAGKDRTGMVAALLLSTLGVADEDILDDYELTSRYHVAERVAAVIDRLRGERGIPPEVAAGIVRTPRWAMESALTEIRQRYGGVDGYLVGPAGVDSSVPEALRQQLLTPG